MLSQHLSEDVNIGKHRVHILKKKVLPIIFIPEVSVLFNISV